MFRVDNGGDATAGGGGRPMPPGMAGAQPYVSAGQYASAFAPRGLGYGPNAAPAPAPASPATMNAVNPALVPHPTAPPSLIPVSQGIHNPTTGQTTPNVGTPSGYAVGQNIDTSYAGLLPQGFSLNNLTAPSMPSATTPGASDYIQQAGTQMRGATDWNVTPQMTVQGQYAGLMAQGNPAIQAAEEQTLRAHAASGGRNDLMAQSAASLTGSQVALSIAAQDANINAQAGQFNANAANAMAEQMNQFIGNAQLSSQNFAQGVAMLKDQSQHQIEQIYSQVQANAATQSTNLKSTLGTLQAQTNATLEQMDKTFSQNVASMNLQHQFADEASWQDYGQKVRLSYLSSVNTQQTALMQAIGQISGNPNITADQATAAVRDAIDQFNSYMTMNNAYYAAMVPGSQATGAQGGTGPYSSAAYDYSIA